MALVMISEQPIVLTAIQHSFAPVLLGSLATIVLKTLMNVTPILVKMEQFAQISYMDHSSVLVVLDGLVRCVIEILTIVRQTHLFTDLVMILGQSIVLIVIQHTYAPVQLGSLATIAPKILMNVILILVKMEQFA
jgi:hypothetical protein